MDARVGQEAREEPRTCTWAGGGEGVRVGRECAGTSAGTGAGEQA